MSPKKAMLLKRIVADEKGLETVEYAIITGLIVAACVTVLAAIGVWVRARYDGLGTNIGAGTLRPAGTPWMRTWGGS